MIEWMQRHKKWLVITIWISTIAFIGAGFVGWGAYDFGKTEGTVIYIHNTLRYSATSSIKNLQNNSDLRQWHFKHSFKNT
jgi:hypothetical protein